MAQATANGIRIEYETFGEPGAPPMLLVMGLGAQMITWDERFCEQLAAEGFLVVRYDNRDSGLSTKFEEAGLPDLGALLTGVASGRPAPVGTAPYGLEDMADDGIGLLDALGIDAAHIVGESMGGMIAQAMVIRHPARVLSLCSIMSTTGDPSVGAPTPEAMGALLTPPPADRTPALAKVAVPTLVIHGEAIIGAIAANARKAAVTPAA
jgi:pimeloyl-ACP methyl ester carboxylesterase